MDVGNFLTESELASIYGLIQLLNAADNAEFFAGDIKFCVIPVDANGEFLGEVNFVDGEYRWYPNGEE